MKQTFFKKIARLYEKMDKAWDQCATFYGFQCSGCEDNCCRSTFYHYTRIEKDYLISGVKALPKDTLVTVTSNLKHHRHRKHINRKHAAEETDSKPMCPLNIEGLCCVYPQRPMICRLHGLPHEFTRPDGKVIKGTGCNAGKAIFDAADYSPLDRTSLYREMALIEAEYRSTSGGPVKLRQSVSQMLAEVL